MLTSFVLIDGLWKGVYGLDVQIVGGFILKQTKDC